MRLEATDSAREARPSWAGVVRKLRGVTLDAGMRMRGNGVSAEKFNATNYFSSSYTVSALCGGEATEPTSVVP